VSDRSQALASQFKQATDNFLKSVENISEADWNRPVKDDARTVGVIAHHVAHGYDATVSVLQALLAGVEMQLTWDDIHGGNAMHAMENHDCTKHATIGLLKMNAESARQTIAGLHDDQLDQLIEFPLFGDKPFPAQGLVENLVIGHIGMHAGDIA